LAGNIFVRDRDEKGPSFRPGMPGINWKVETRVLSGWQPKLSQQKSSVGQDRQTEEAGNNKYGGLFTQFRLLQFNPTTRRTQQVPFLGPSRALG
jgi:hypothetical protein